MKESEYAKELIRLMEEGIICLSCPSIHDPGSKTRCQDCFAFIGYDYNRFYCPCSRFGQDEALKLTWIALEEKGYLEEI